jgi:hypothetical protein
MEELKSILLYVRIRQGLQVNESEPHSRFSLMWILSYLSLWACIVEYRCFYVIQFIF